MEEAKSAEAIVLASIDAYNRHDLDGCMAFFSPSATWEIIGMGQALSPEELRIAFWQYFLRDVRVEVRSITSAGSLVATEYVQTYTDDDQHRRLSAPIACFYEVQGEQITRVRLYYHPSWDRAQDPDGEA